MRSLSCALLLLASLTILSYSLRLDGVLSSRGHITTAKIFHPLSHSKMHMKAAISLPPISFPARNFALKQILSPFSKAFSKLSVGWTAIAALFAVILAKGKAKVKTAATNAMESGWLKRGTGGSLSRTIEVWIFTFKFLFKYLSVEKFNPAKKMKKLGDKVYSDAMREIDDVSYKAGKKELASLLRDKLLELGPTFIKLGQLLSTRIDILPREYIDALVSLQDKVPGFSGDVAVNIIEQQLGKPIDQLYDTFDRTPLAAASLGQVHVATLNGQKLAVKIQRQGLKDLFDMDLKNIKVLAQILDKFDPKSDGAQRDWVSIYDESAKLLYREIDYENEALNSMRFKEQFKDIPWIKVPEVYTNLTNTTVVTMEYVPGIKINDIERIEKAGIDRQLLAKRSAESYLAQLCRHGFFHCDPHPGNVACDAEFGGRLIYYDFGMMDELKTNVRAGLVDLIFGIYENDYKEVCDALEKMGILRKGVDRVSVEKIARFFLNEFKRGAETGAWANKMSKEERAALTKSRRQQLGADLFSVGSDVPFKFPPTFTFVFRAFTTLDGIGKGLDPAYDLTRLAQPFLKELVDLRDGSATLSFLKTWGKQLGWRPIDISNAVQSPRKVAYLENVLTKMEQGDLKMRVRVLESERAFQRMELVQNNMAVAIAASAFLNAGLVLASSSPFGELTWAARGALALAGVFGLQLPVGLAKLKSLDKKFASLS